MIVAVAIFAVIMLVVNQMFNLTSRAISRGTAMSDVISGARGAEKMIQLDASAMVGPHDNDEGNRPGSGLATLESGGFLIIVNHILGDTNNNGVLDGDTDGNGMLEGAEIGNNP
ncbi:MAG: hypothetical protein MI741_12220, partial [Rhodospirillales bacterium]|nr:hypothetical protein [Rhodospirillales bacterium]